MGFRESPSASAAPQPDGEVNIHPEPERASASVLPFAVSEMAETRSVEVVSPKTPFTRKSAAHFARSTALPRPGERNSASTDARGVASGRLGPGGSRHERDRFPAARHVAEVDRGRALGTLAERDLQARRLQAVSRRGSCSSSGVRRRFRLEQRRDEFVDRDGVGLRLDRLFCARGCGDLPCDIPLVLPGARRA